MSGAQTSTFPSMNELLAPQYLNIQQQQQAVRNQLAPYQVQEAQQKVGDADMAAVGQASQALLNNYGDEASRAAAYPGIVADLQQQGFAKNAPSVYPGEAALKTIIGRSLSVQEQYNLGLATNPEWTRQFQQLYGGGAQGAGGTAGAPGGGGSGLASQPLTGDINHDRPIIVARESGGNPTALNYVAMADPSAYERGATASGKYQFVNSTWREGMQLAGLDPSQYKTARSAPEAVQDKVFDAVYGKYGTTPWDASKRTQDWVPTPSGRFILASAAPGATPPAAQGSAPARFPPGTVQAAGPAAGPPPAAPATPPAAPATPPAAPATPPAAPATPPAAPATPPAAPAQGDLVGPRPLPPIGPNSSVVTPESLANTPVLVAQNQLAPGAPGAPPAQQPPAAATLATQPPAAAQPPAPQPAAAQPQQANLPHRADVPTGVQTPQFQQAQALLARAAQAKALAAQMPPNSPMARQIAVAAARDEQLAASLQQQDNIVQTQEGQLITRTGEMKDPAKPLPNWQLDPNGGGPGIPAFIDTTKTNKPEPLPTRRAYTLPDGRMVNDLGQDITSTMTAAQVEEAKANAKRLGEVRAEAMATAQQAQQTDTLITNTQAAMQAAMKGKIPPGKFGPELLQLTAAAKSLGVDLSPFGVDENALAAGQVTREQLQMINGAILRKMFPQRVTNVDIATAGSALPNYGLDPESIMANFRIYKAQADYDRAKAIDMLQYEDAHHNSLDGWESQWYQKHGFASGPLDNFFGDAKAGSLAKGSTSGSTASAQPQYREGDTATGKGGAKIIFRGGNWVPL